MPPLFMMLPPREKKGRASREKLSRPEKHFCAAVKAKPCRSERPEAMMATTEAMPMPAEMGTPAKSITKKTANRIIVALITITCPLLSYP